MYMIQNLLTFYTAAMPDVIAYINTAHDSVTFSEPPSTANKSVNYFQLFEEIKSVLTVSYQNDIEFARVLRFSDGSIFEI